jgi:hypothetical protein
VFLVSLWFPLRCAGGVALRGISHGPHPPQLSAPPGYMERLNFHG